MSDCWIHPSSYSRVTPARVLGRRAFLTAVAVGIFGLPAKTIAQGSLPEYCSLNGDTDLARYSPSNTTGNTRLDRALIAELKKIMKVLPVNPGFKVIQDNGRPNAFAIPRALVSGTRGTVLFGRALINDEMSTRDGGHAVAGIAAHECTHIFQFFSQYGRRLTEGQATARAMELHADFMAGYFLGRDRANQMNIAVFAHSLYSKGDWAFNDPGHHGTPQERVAAMKRGYSLATGGENFDSAAEQGARYVLG